MDELTKAVKIAFPNGVNGWKIMHTGYKSNEGSFGITHGVWLHRYGRKKFVPAISILAGSSEATGAAFRQALEEATNPIYDLSDAD